MIGRLVEVKGIGRWTAEIFLMFHLHRPDVLPVDDLGICARGAADLRPAPAAERGDGALELGEAWRPTGRLPAGTCGGASSSNAAAAPTPSGSRWRG